MNASDKFEDSGIHSSHVFVFYRQLAGVTFTATVMLTERKKAFPSSPFSILVQGILVPLLPLIAIFSLATFGCR